MISSYEYEIALKRIEEIFDSKPGDSTFEELKNLTSLVEEYEKIHYPMDDKK